MAVEYITSRNLADLIYETVRLMNRTMAHHGMRVSYIMAKMLETQGTSAASVEQPVLDSLMLAQALGQISDRERYIFLRVLWRSAALTILPQNSAWGIRESPQPITEQFRN